MTDEQLQRYDTEAELLFDFTKDNDIAEADGMNRMVRSILRYRELNDGFPRLLNDNEPTETARCLEIDFWSRCAALMQDDTACPYNDLMTQLRETAKQYWKTFRTCHIFGSEVDFEHYCLPEDVERVCQDIWDHPDNYSKWLPGSERAWTEFLKFLWVEMADGKEVQLAKMVNRKP